MRARRREGLPHLQRLMEMGVDGLNEFGVVLLCCNRKCPAFSLNRFRNSSQVGVDQTKKMQRQSILAA